MKKGKEKCLLKNEIFKSRRKYAQSYYGLGHFE